MHIGKSIRSHPTLISLAVTLHALKHAHTFYSYFSFLFLYFRKSSLTLFAFKLISSHKFLYSSLMHLIAIATAATAAALIQFCLYLHFMRRDVEKKYLTFFKLIFFLNQQNFFLFIFSLIKKFTN